MMHGIILYGPPGAGKDTITAALHKIDQRYELYRRMKIGTGRTEGYAISDTNELAKARAEGRIVWENERYDATYVIERGSLYQLLAGHIPVIHVGQVEAINAVRIAVPEATWFVVNLWCPRHIAIQRIMERGTDDDVLRMQAWDETEQLDDADLVIDTSRVSAVDAAKTIEAAYRGICPRKIG